MSVSGGISVSAIRCVHPAEQRRHAAAADHVHVIHTVRASTHTRYRGDQLGRRVGRPRLSRAGSFAGGYHGFRGALGTRCSQRQGDGERGAFADAVAGRGDASLVGLDQRLDDG